MGISNRELKEDVGGYGPPRPCFCISNRELKVLIDRVVAVYDEMVSISNRELKGEVVGKRQLLRGGPASQIEN